MGSASAGKGRRAGANAPAVGLASPSEAIDHDDVRTIIEATYRVIARTDSLDPGMRDILREAGLSTPAFYRHFKGKDELLLVLLDNGRRQLCSYLGHQMAKQRTPEGKVGAWIRGVIAQSADPVVADRTRPFIVNLPRMADRYPGAHTISLQVLADLLVQPITSITGRPGTARTDGMLVVHLAMGVLNDHLRDRTFPTATEVDHIVQFALAALKGPRRARRRDDGHADVS